ncbi:M23 family metallopeptidase [Nocardioidaceae bacterium]|nr:M23 family metallopeptidase [Nocardioidaceae bacterium]
MIAAVLRWNPARIRELRSREGRWVDETGGILLRIVVVLAMVLGTPFFAILFVLIIGPSSRSAACLSAADADGGSGGAATSGGAANLADLTPAQRANASTIIAEGERLHLPDKAIVIALATASQESRFLNYANDGLGGDLTYFRDGIAASLRLPHEAVGTDHGSLGVFQQQWPYWGSMRELMDPAISARIFYRSLIEVPAWEQMPVTAAAQAVQVSAYPDAYADDEALARQLLAETRRGTPGMSNASFASAAACEPAITTVAAITGPRAFPLPAGTAYVDQHNFGGTSARWANTHTGTDLSAACGTPVLAAHAGVIEIDTTQSWSGPWLVKVATAPGQLTTWYAHMSDVRVHDGQAVAAGQQIGEVGDLGNSTGCHLHFEVHPDGGSIYEDPIDPSPWLVNQPVRN